MCEASWSHGNRPFALANATPPSTNLSFQISRKTTLSARKHWAKHPPRSKHRPDLCKMKDCIDREHSLFVLKFSIMRRHLYSLVAHDNFTRCDAGCQSKDICICRCHALWMWFTLTHVIIHHFDTVYIISPLYQDYCGESATQNWRQHVDVFRCMEARSPAKFPHSAA